MLASDPDQLSQPGLELLGVAHRGCADLARQRLEARQVKLPTTSPSSSPMREPASCRHCTGHPRLADAPSASKLISPTSNNRWLAVLEHDVKLLLGSLVLGREQTLPPSAQPLLATWAVKTALMLDLSGGQPLIPTGFYHDFQLQRSPLPSQIVWIGAYRDSTRAAWARHDGLHVGISADEPPNAFSTTFDGIASTVEQARAAARGKDVHVAGGAATVQRALNAGLVDELQLHLASVLLGARVRLFHGAGR